MVRSDDLTTAPTTPVAFWAPLDDVAIEDAMRLGAVGRDSVFLDLGCGDGRVMEAALERGAIAKGVELDPRLAQAARTRLARFGDRASVVEASFYTTDLEADVVFAYLTPAVLQRLAPRLARMASDTRIVTAWFTVPGWAPSSYRGNCHLFQIPVEGDRTPATECSWHAPGILCFLPPRGRFLVTAEVIHPVGAVQIATSPSLRSIAEVSHGASVLDAPQPVAVDLVFDARRAGTRVVGALDASGAGTCELFCAYHADDVGYWPLDGETCARLRRAFI